MNVMDDSVVGLKRPNPDGNEDSKDCDHRYQNSEDFPGNLIKTHMYYILAKDLSMFYPGPETWY